MCTLILVFSPSLAFDLRKLKSFSHSNHFYLKLIFSLFCHVFFCKRIIYSCFLFSLTSQPFLNLIQSSFWILHSSTAVLWSFVTFYHRILSGRLFWCTRSGWTTTSSQHCSLVSMMTFFLGSPLTFLTGNLDGFPTTSISLFPLLPIPLYPLYQIQKDLSQP